MAPEISVIIPVLNEAENLRLVLPEVVACIEELGQAFAILVIDDASTDATRDIAAEWSRKDPRIRLIALPHNTQKAGALRRGFLEAKGAVIITMDGDMQDDPRNIPLLLSCIARGADVVVGWKKSRKDLWTKRCASRAWNVLCRLCFGMHLHDMNCGLKAYRRHAVRDLQLPGSLYRFIPLILQARGYRVEEVVVHHRQRTYGQSKFAVWHRLRGITDVFAVIALVAREKRLAAQQRSLGR